MEKRMKFIFMHIFIKCSSNSACNEFFYFLSSVLNDLSHTHTHRYIYIYIYMRDRGILIFMPAASDSTYSHHEKISLSFFPIWIQDWIVFVRYRSTSPTRSKLWWTAHYWIRRCNFEERKWRKLRRNDIPSLDFCIKGASPTP